MAFKICSVPVAAMRKEPSHRSEMVSQLVFGENCDEIFSSEGEWSKIKSVFDGYEGYCQSGQLALGNGIGNEFPLQLVSERTASIQFDGIPMWIPFGSSLQGIHEGHLSWGDHQISYFGELWDPVSGNRSPETIRMLALKFINTPYLWGGKSIFGIDCSGYTQTIFKFLDIALRRDAYQQAEQGWPIPSLKDTICGDLAFFDNPEGRITHVGIVLTPHEIAHSSGKVRIDLINESGILNKKSGLQTHHLCRIRRFF